MRIGPFVPMDYAVITTLGLEFAVAMALGVGGGLWADRMWQTEPWCALLGTVGGFALGMYIVCRAAQKMSAQQTPHTQDKKHGNS